MTIRKNGTRIGKRLPRGQVAQLITATASYGPKATASTATPAARAAQTDFSAQADGVNTARIMRNGDGSISAESGFGNGTKKYSAEQIKWIMSRGASGGGLSKQDKAVYDRMMWIRANDEAKAQQAAQEQKALDAAHAEDERKRQLDMKDWEQQEKIRRDARNEDELAREKRKAEADAAALAEKRQYDEQQAKLQAQAKLDAENAKYEALNKKYGIAEGTRLTDKDYGDLEAGRSKWGYSQRDQQAVDKINDDYDEAIRSRKFSDRQKITRNGVPVLGTDPEGKTEAEWAKVARDEALAQFEKRLVPNDQPPTAEQLYNSSFAAPDGTRLIANGSGGLVAIPGTGPQKEVETPAEKNARVAQERKDKWLDSRISELLKMTKKEKGEDKEEIETPMFTYDTAYQQAMKDMAVRFPSAPSTQTGEPSIAGGEKQIVQAGVNAISDWRKALGW